MENRICVGRSLRNANGDSSELKSMTQPSQGVFSEDQGVSRSRCQIRCQPTSPVPRGTVQLSLSDEHIPAYQRFFIDVSAVAREFVVTYKRAARRPQSQGRRATGQAVKGPGMYPGPAGRSSRSRPEVHVGK